ncbi:MAG: vitamin K epoxide reductase family protein [Armatimonadetes bacterium]|nr:vitamin K epoxide reductase family protein [Armatimonadota bacterium]
MGVLPGLGNQVIIEVRRGGEALGAESGIPTREPHIPPVLASEDHVRWDSRRRAEGRERRRRLAIAGLSVLGLLDSLYMLAYEEEWIDSMACPFFGEGCEKVGRSAHARHFGVPNAAVGAVGYGVMAVLALWRGRPRRARRSWQSAALAAMSGLAAAASLFLTWEQPARVRAWCFWCLTSAAINAAILPLSLRECTRTPGDAEGGTQRC